MLRIQSEKRWLIIKNTILLSLKARFFPVQRDKVIQPVLEKESGKSATMDFGIGSNPEFLKEGSAVNDFFHTDRIVIGANDPKTKKTMEDLYKPLLAPIFTTDIQTAEMIKYVSNAFLATKISFANEIGNLCKSNEIDSYEVFQGVGMDKPNQPSFLPVGNWFWGFLFSKRYSCPDCLCRITSD